MEHMIKIDDTGIVLIDVDGQWIELTAMVASWHRCVHLDTPDMIQDFDTLTAKARDRKK